MLRGTFRSLTSWKNLLHNPQKIEMDYLRMVKASETHHYTQKLMIKACENFKHMKDEEILELLINFKVKKVNYAWVANRKGFFSETLERIKKNDSLWEPDKYSLVFQVLLNLPCKIDSLNIKIHEAMQNININLQKYCLEDLAVFKEFSKLHYPSLYETISDAFIEIFIQSNNFSLLNFPEILTVTNVLAPDFDKYSTNENFLQKFLIFTNRVFEVVESNFETEQSAIIDLSYLYHKIPLKYCDSLHKLIAYRIFDNINNKQSKFTVEKILNMLTLLKNINISSTVKQFLMKKFCDFIGPTIFKSNKKMFSVSEMTLYERVFIMLSEIKIYYPSFILSLFLNLKFREFNVFGGGKTGTELLTSFAFFNFLEIIKYMQITTQHKSIFKQLETYALADINSVQQMISNLDERDEPIRKNDFKKVVKMGWYCSIFDFKNYFQAKKFIKFINKNNSELSQENYNKINGIRNWIKYELKIEENIIMPNYYIAEKLDKIALNEDENYKLEFKKEVKQNIAEGFIEDYEIEGYTIDFANPDTKFAIFLDNKNQFLNFENDCIPLGNLIVAFRVLEILGWKVEVLTVYNYHYSTPSFIKKVKIS